MHRVFVVIMTVLISSLAFAEVAGVSHDELWGGAVVLQPRASQNEHVMALVNEIAETTPQHRIDPRLAVTIAFRESSLNPAVGFGQRDGQRGERGWFQIMPNGAAQRLCGRCDLYDTACNARTFACYAAQLRERCIGEGHDGDIAMWLAAYGGRGRCPQNGMEYPEVRIARRHLCTAYGEAVCNEVWPLQEEER